MEKPGSVELGREGEREREREEGGIDSQTACIEGLRKQ